MRQALNTMDPTVIFMAGDLEPLLPSVSAAEACGMATTEDTTTRTEWLGQFTGITTTSIGVTRVTAPFTQWLPIRFIEDAEATEVEGSTSAGDE